MVVGCREKVGRVHFVVIMKGITWFDWTVLCYTCVHAARRNWNRRVGLFLLNGIN